MVLDRKHHLRPPRMIARVAQRQQRGADHLHRVYLARRVDERERMQAWVEAYRKCASDYGFGFVDDPFRTRRGRDGGGGARAAPIAMVVMLFGIGFLSVLTATIASRFVKTDTGAETEEILLKLERIETELGEVKQQLAKR